MVSDGNFTACSGFNSIALLSRKFVRLYPWSFRGAPELTPTKVLSTREFLVKRSLRDPQGSALLREWNGNRLSVFCLIFRDGDDDNNGGVPTTECECVRLSTISLPLLRDIFPFLCLPDRGRRCYCPGVTTTGGDGDVDDALCMSARAFAQWTAIFSQLLLTTGGRHTT